MSTHSDRLLDPADLVDLEQQPMESVRAKRNACVEFETGLSYLRRLVQGSMDIIQSELDRRAGGGGAESAGGLVDALPSILGEVPRPPGMGRLSSALEPTELDDELAHQFDSLLGQGRLAKVADLDGDELRSLLDRLGMLERQVSGKRHAFHTRIDALQAELTRRYRTGEATVDSLLEAT